MTPSFYYFTPKTIKGNLSLRLVAFTFSIYLAKNSDNSIPTFLTVLTLSRLSNPTQIGFALKMLESLSY